MISCHSSDDEDCYQPLILPANFIAESTDVKTDGRIDVDIDSSLGRALSLLVPPPIRTYPSPPLYTLINDNAFDIKLNIVIQVVGSRGDVQPFIALGCELQKHGHRVRLATHDVFESFVRESGLEFYPIGGDPAELMAYMVKNPALIPSMKSLRAGDIQAKRHMISKMLLGCWKSCIQPDEFTGDEFVADAIIANPPSFAHVHCAQALGIPVHLMFTMPWTSTRSFPHPLANLKFSGGDAKMSNYISYGIVDFMTWQGLGDVINDWRQKTLDLEPVPLTEGPGLLDTLEVPFTYCWSPALIPKPTDWGSHIDVCGFFFRDTPAYNPPVELGKFLQASPQQPVYIGFGSIVIEDPERMTAIILEAVRLAGVRAIISRGWSKLGAGEHPDVFYLDDCPHEWLFRHVAAVVHHGGAGTTACGLLNGKPTTIVPFFGDQPFWGRMVAAAGAGPEPIPNSSLTSLNLSNAIRFCLQPEATTAARRISQKMGLESGVKAAVKSFHSNLPRSDLQCDLIPNEPASLRYRHGKNEVTLSKLAAGILTKATIIERKHLHLHETKTIVIDVRRWDPVTAITSASISTMSSMAGATIDIVRKPYLEYRIDKEKSQEGQSSSATKEVYGTAESSSAPAGNKSDPYQSIHEQRDLGGLVQLAEHPAVKRKGLQIAGVMALASAGSVAKVFVSSSKGVLVDIPLAMAEGMRAVPRFYDHEYRDYGKVTDYKSGMTVAGKTFGRGVYEGLTDIFVETYKGKKKEGAKGVAKGLGKGIVSLTMKTGAGIVGLVAYSGQGVSRSIRSTVRGGVQNVVLDAKCRESEWLLANDAGANIEHANVVAAFLAARKMKS